MEWNYLWVKQEQYRERVRQLEEAGATGGETSPPLPDSVRFTLAGFLIGVGIAAGLAFSRAPRNQPVVPTLPMANPLTLEPLPDPGAPAGTERLQSPELSSGRRLPASRTGRSNGTSSDRKVQEP